VSENPEEEIQGESDHHEFRVVLKGLNIPIEVRKRIEAEIRQVVLKEIAGLDLRDEHIMDCDVKKHQEEMAKRSILWQTGVDAIEWLFYVLVPDARKVLFF
jgi:hypothetical protein